MGRGPNRVCRRRRYFGVCNLHCRQGKGSLVMWILVWLSFVDGRFEYYQLGSFGTEAHCNRAKVKAEVMVKNPAQAVTCFSVERV